MEYVHCGNTNFPPVFGSCDLDIAGLTHLDYLLESYQIIQHAAL